MKMVRVALITILVSLPLLVVASTILAQGTGPLLMIQGVPDTQAAPPEVWTYVSVVDKATAKTIEDLAADKFQVKEAGTPVTPVSVAYQPVGLAIVVVVDRGGISQDARLKDATGLVQELVRNRLSITGASTDDIVAVVGVGEKGALEPDQNFTYGPVDTNLVANALVEIEQKPVRSVTPLYEGLDEALRLLTRNPDARIRDALQHRRKAILVLSDGIDREYSNTVREQDIIIKAGTAGVSLYAIGLAGRGGTLDPSAEKALIRLGSQTDGAYELHRTGDDKTHQQVLGLLDRVMTQRSQYRVSYRTHQPKGDYTLSVLVSTALGSAERSTSFSSILELPQIALVPPAGGVACVVPYSASLKGPSPTTATLSAQITPRDGVSRLPVEVHYLADGKLIGTGTNPPDFAYIWKISEVEKPTNTTLTRTFTLAAEAADAYLGTKMTTASPLTITAKWEPVVETVPETFLGWVRRNWGVLLILVLMAAGLGVLFFLLIRTRIELVAKLRKGATGFSDFVKGLTRPIDVSQLSANAPPQRPMAKLVVLEGKLRPNEEFPLSGGQVVVGRDPYACDISLDDLHVSNPHFYIYQEGTDFFIEDRGSLNKTLVEGKAIEPNQRIRLQPDQTIQAGFTKLKFVHMGKATRPIAIQEVQATEVEG